MAGNVVIEGAELLPVFKIRLPLAAETDDLKQKTVVTCRKNIGALGKNPVQIRTSVKESRSLTMKSKRHISLPRGHPRALPEIG